jgi:hypothetical protein
MTDEPVDLDEHRGMAAQKATEIRRERLYRFEQDQADLRRQQEELEVLLLPLRPRPGRKQPPRPSISSGSSPTRWKRRTRAARRSWRTRWRIWRGPATERRLRNEGSNKNSPA